MRKTIFQKAIHEIAMFLILSVTPLLQRSSGTASSRRGPSRSIQYAEPFGDGLAVNPGSVGQL